MSRYRETFRRHRVMLIVPVIIAILVSGWYAKKTPTKYETAMTLWFDTAAPNTSSLEQMPSGGTPADQGQAVLQEFLATAQFLVKVGHRGPLGAYLMSSGRAASAGVVNSEIVGTLQKAFVVSTTGPQIVEVTMTGTQPAYMAGTLQAVADEYVAEVTSDLRSRDAQSVAYFTTQVAAAKAALVKANATVTAYSRAHPGAVPSLDPSYGQVVQLANQDEANLTNLQNSLQQATLALQNVQAPNAFHVIDPPAAPLAQSNKKHEILIGAAGLLGGVVISILLLSALTSLDKTARNEQDIDEALGVEVVATITELPRRRKSFLIRGASTS